MKKLLIIIFFFTFIQCENDENSYKQIIQISIPKAGTHLLAKCISLLTNRSHVIWSDKTNSTFEYQNLFIVSMAQIQALTNLSASEFWMPHLFYLKEYEDYLANNNFTKFFVYRDPRDQVISFAFYMLRYKNLWPKASSLTFDELIMDLIAEGTSFNNIPPTKNVDTLYRSYLPWLNTPNIVAIRFEDLVGPKGGGTYEEQFNAIQKIAKHLEIILTSDQTQEISQKLFGDTYSFREGKIGTWKKHFNKDHIEAFKKNAGNLLIELGYEKDLNW